MIERLETSVAFLQLLQVERFHMCNIRCENNNLTHNLQYPSNTTCPVHDLEAQPKVK